MSLLTLLCLSSVLMKLEASSPGVCKLVTAKTSILQKGKRLYGFQFYRLTTVPDFIQCARNCFFRRRCLSFNYNEKSLVCEFNNARVDSYAVLTTTRDYVYSEIGEWDKAIGMGPCWNQPCGICEACYPTESNYICVKEELTSCRDIKICTKTISDGHYLIRPVMGTKPWLKIYCYRMGSSYPKDYLTLPELNFSENSPYNCTEVDWNNRFIGFTTYYKIRLDVTNLEVSKTDRTFAKLSCDPKLFGLSKSPPGRNCTYSLYYATASQCSLASCQPKKGKFRVDLRGTGLAVSPLVKWNVFGISPTITSINRSASNQVIEGICGGSCGGCNVRGPILEPKP